MRVARASPAVAVAAAFVLLVVGCGSTAANKAGGSLHAKPLVLTLAAHDDADAYGGFATAVDRLSGGSIEIRIAGNWRASGDRGEIAYERGIADDVRAGKVQLGIVGVRVWDTLGVETFRALLAPFLIESLSLERRALESPPAATALASVRRAGVVGIALLPGRLRRPLGITRSLVRPEDFAGARIGIRPDAVAGATFRALGATPDGYVPGDLSGFDGADLDPLTITQNNYDRAARALTGNVVFWPKPETIVMSLRAYDRLTPEQRSILRAAGRRARTPELARVRRDQSAGMSALCAGTIAIATATPVERAALRRAVQPVYDRLERDRFTRRWIAQITGMKRAAPSGPDAVLCPSPTTPHRVAASELDGHWTGSLTLEQIIRAGLPRPLAVKLRGSWTAQLGDGRFVFHDRETGVTARGTFAIRGQRVGLVFATGVGIEHEQRADFTWSIYRDRLTFRPIPGRPGLLVDLFVWKRAS